MRIKEAIKERGLTVGAVASRMGVVPQALSRVINGNPTVEMVERVAAAIGVPVSDLFDKTGISGYVEVGGVVKKISSIADMEEILNRMRQGKG